MSFKDKDRVSVGVLIENTAAEKRRASLVICSHARDAVDARLIMTALGLWPVKP